MGLTARDRYDAVIVGGGLAGLTLARQLVQARPDLRLLVVEKRKHPVPEAAFKVGESSTEVAGHYLNRMLGLKDHLKSHQLRKLGLRFFCTAGDNRDITRRVEYGPPRFPPVPGYQLDRGRLENFLAETNTELGVEFLDEASVRRVNLDDRGHTITLQRAGEDGSVRARWVVDASGRTCLLKRQLGMARAYPEHDCHAAWFRLNTTIDVDDWSSDPSWLKDRLPRGLRRFSTNHLVGRGYWVWLIPLAGGETSVGIVVDSKYHPFNELTRFEPALEWLRRHEPQCADVVEAARGQLMDFRVLRHFSHSCERVFSSDRWALTGESGVFTDPLYSPGSDFIAMANCFITDLIVRDLEGESIERRVQQHNDLYFYFFNNTMKLYQGQYGLLGNAQMIVAKIIWDQAFFWGVLALLFIQHKLHDVEFMAEVFDDVRRGNQIDAFVQSMFQEWDRLNEREWQDAWVTIRPDEFPFGLHARLAYSYTDEELRAALHENVRLLEAVALYLQQGLSERTARFGETGLFGSQPGVPFALSDSPEALAGLVPADLDRIWLESARVTATTPA